MDNKTSKGFSINRKTSLAEEESKRKSYFSFISQPVISKVWEKTISFFTEDEIKRFSILEDEQIKKDTAKVPLQWVKKNTAIIVIHGIGNQLPLETLDAFGRGLLKQYKRSFPGQITISHKLAQKPSDRSGVWFDNVVRINHKDDPYFIDLYEYYWANYTEDKASTKDINDWVTKATDAAGSFYGVSKNAEMGAIYHGEGLFFDKLGRFNKKRYKLFLFFVKNFLPAVQAIAKFFLKLIAKIPVVGSWAESILANKGEQIQNNINNVIGDLVVYNVADPKSKYYDIRRQILDGAVNALRYLIEKTNDDKKLSYDSIIVAGHSLGSEVGYDAINKLNLLVTQNDLPIYNADGSSVAVGPSIYDRLKGFITFGSPLDKVAFFLREIVPDELYLRQQLLDSYHCFKQRDWSLRSNNDPDFTPFMPPAPSKRLFDGMLWINYYDRYDYVSDPLNFYEKLTNVDCRFGGNRLFSFTHSSYWTNDNFYKNIIFNFLE